MARQARIVVPGRPHHIAGYHKFSRDLFLTDEDRRTYLCFLLKYTQKHGLDVLAYCMMPNHVHLLAVPKWQHSISRTFADTHMQYAKYFNSTHGESGQLWRGRIRSCVLDLDHAVAATKHIERNPVRKAKVSRAWQYEWSSAKGRVGKRADPLLRDRWPPKRFLPEWRALLEEADDHERIERIRSGTRTGRPVGTDRFVRKIESAVGRRLRPKKPGRPRKPRPEPS